MSGLKIQVRLSEGYIAHIRTKIFKNGLCDLLEIFSYSIYSIYALVWLQEKKVF